MTCTAVPGIFVSTLTASLFFRIFFFVFAHYLVCRSWKWRSSWYPDWFVVGFGWFCFPCRLHKCCASSWLRATYVVYCGSDTLTQWSVEMVLRRWYCIQYTVPSDGTNFSCYILEYNVQKGPEKPIRARLPTRFYQGYNIKNITRNSPPLST